jgi:GTPase SAR1 family protein
MDKLTIIAKDIEKKCGLIADTLSAVVLPECGDFVLNYYQSISTRNHVVVNNDGIVLGLNIAANNLNDPQMEFLSEFPNLRLLDLSGNNIRSFILPDVLTNLEYLDLSENEALQELQLLTVMPNLFKLLVYRTGLQSLVLPRFCPRLNHVEARNSKLQNIDFAQDLPNLEFVDVGFNQISSLNLSVNLPSLKYFSVRNNEIQQLSWENEIPNLEILNFDNNKLNQLPKKLCLSSKIYMLFLFKNPLVENLQPLVGSEESRDCHIDVLNHLRDLYGNKDKAVRNNEVRLILLGNPTMGKTALARALIENVYISEDNRDMNDVSTHGILIHKWNIERKRGIKIKIWDFGGQEYYHATHKLFLSHNAVFLMVCTHESEGENRRQSISLRTKILKGDNVVLEDRNTVVYPLSHWFDTVEFFRGGRQNEAFIVVQNKEDRCPSGYTVPMENISLPMHDKFYKISLEKTFGRPIQRDENVKAKWNAFENGLIELLKANLEEFEMELWCALLREEMARRRDNSVYYMSWSEYVLLAEEIKPGCNDHVKGGRTALQRLTVHLHATGEVLWFENEQALKDTVFLHPEWITDKIYEILSYDVLEAEGRINLQETRKKLGPKFGVGVLNWLFEIMQEFHLLFKPKYSHDILIAPQYLPDIEYQLRNSSSLFNPVRRLFERTNCRLFVLKFSKPLPRSVIVRIICEFGQLSKDTFWKDGLIFESKSDSKVTIRIQEVISKNEIEFFADQPDAPLVYPELITRIREILKWNEDVRISRDGRDFVFLEDLMRKLDLDLGNVNVIDSAMDKRKILQIDQFRVFKKYKSTNPFNLSATSPIKIALSYAHKKKDDKMDIELPVIELEKILAKESHVELIRDKTKIGDDHYLEFARKMANADKYVAFFSKRYFKSVWCVYELCYVYEHKNWAANRDLMARGFFNIIVEDVSWSDGEFHNTIISYWENAKKEDAKLNARTQIKTALELICAVLPTMLGNIMQRPGKEYAYGWENVTKESERLANKILSNAFANE